jgi:hypothetical protein
MFDPKASLYCTKEELFPSGACDFHSIVCVLILLHPWGRIMLFAHGTFICGA